MDSELSQLRNQLNEANSRWRREEKRAKAREEELELQLQFERNRLQEVSKELDEVKLTLDETKEKLRESTRKRQQVQAQNQVLVNELEELKPFKLQCDDLETALRAAREELSLQTKQTLELQRATAEQQAHLDESLAENSKLTVELSALKLERDQVAKLKTELSTSEEKLDSLKIAMKHNAQLVRDLKSELAKSVNRASSAPPPVAPTPDDGGGSSELVKELASRLESLLKENETLAERVRYLEDVIQQIQRNI